MKSDSQGRIFPASTRSNLTETPMIQRSVLRLERKIGTSEHVWNRGKNVFQVLKCSEDIRTGGLDVETLRSEADCLAISVGPDDIGTIGCHPTDRG